MSAFLFSPSSSLALPAPFAARAETPSKRGLYLVTITGCAIAIRPGPCSENDKASSRWVPKWASGADVRRRGGPESDARTRKTRLGGLTSDQIVTAITTAKTPMGGCGPRIMPGRALEADARGCRGYRGPTESLPVENAVSGPYKGADARLQFPSSCLRRSSPKLPNPLPPK